MEIRTARRSSPEKSAREAKRKDENRNTDGIQNNRKDKNYAEQLRKRSGKNVEPTSSTIKGNTRKEDKPTSKNYSEVYGKLIKADTDFGKLEQHKKAVHNKIKGLRCDRCEYTTANKISSEAAQNGYT